MKTLQEDIDDLDRMLDTDAAKDAIRSQIRLIAREAAALEIEFASLAQSHTDLQNALAQSNEKNAQLVAEKSKRDTDARNEMAGRSQDIESDYRQS
jgi:hypothetical protein